MLLGDGLTDATTLTLTGTATANSTVEVFDGSTQLGTAAVNSSGAWSYVASTLANGSHSFTATDTVAGNVSALSAVLSVTVDDDAADGNVGVGIAVERRPRGRQRGDADAHHERGGDGQHQRRHPDADAQRWRHRDLHRRLGQHAR